MDLRGTHILLTGASSGIGEALALALAERGARLTLVARREQRLNEVAAACAGDEHHVISADLSDLDRVQPIVDEATQTLGPIDVLVNNAGVQIVRRMELTSVEDAEWLMRIDTLAPFRLIQAVLPQMLERQSGAIVNIASLAALAPTSGMFYYNAAKAALAGGSESLYGEVRDRGVHVCTVYPGPVETDMATAAIEKFDKDPTKMMPVGTTTVLARKVVRCIEKRKPRLIYPASYAAANADEAQALAAARAFPGITRIVMDNMTPPLSDE